MTFRDRLPWSTLADPAAGEADVRAALALVALSGPRTYVLAMRDLLLEQRDERRESVDLGLVQLRDKRGEAGD